MDSIIKKDNYRKFCYFLAFAVTLVGVFLALKFRAEEHLVIEKSSTFEGSEIKIFNDETLLAGDYTCSFDYDGTDDVKMQIIALGSYELSYNGPVNFTKSFDKSAHKATLHFTVDKPYYMVNRYVSSENNVKIENFILRSDSAVYRNTVLVRTIVISLSIVFLVVSIWLIKKNKYDIFVAVLLSVVVGVVSCLPYFNGRPRSGYDYAFHLNRIKGIALYIKNFTLPGRLNGAFNAGYGYANSIMYPELTLYIAGAFVALGMEGNLAMIVFFCIINILTALIGTYSFTLLSENIYLGVSLSAVYTACFYRLQNVYMRAATGETVYMTFLPLAVCALYKLMEKGKAYWALLAVAMTGVLQSHIIGSVFTVIILAVEFLILAVAMIIRKEFEFRILIDGIKAVAFTLLLNIWFFAPFLFFYFTQDFIMFEKVGAAITYIERLVPIRHFFSLDVYPIDPHESMGIMLYLGLFLAIVGIIWSVRSKKNRNAVISTAFIICGLIFGIMCTDVVPWAKLFDIALIREIMIKIQFSFRLYAVYIVSICLAATLALNKFDNKTISVSVMVLSVVLSVWSCGFFGEKVSSQNAVPDSMNAAPFEYMMQGADMMREVINDGIKTTENITVVSYEKEDTTINITYTKNDDEAGTIKLPLFYYYGYRAVDADGNNVNLVSGENCTVTINDMPSSQGTKTVKVFYDNGRKIFKYPLIVSVVSTFIFPFFIYFDWKRRKI